MLPLIILFFIIGKPRKGNPFPNGYRGALPILNRDYEPTLNRLIELRLAIRKGFRLMNWEENGGP